MTTEGMDVERANQLYDAIIASSADLSAKQIDAAKKLVLDHYLEPKRALELVTRPSFKVPSRHALEVVRQMIVKTLRETLEKLDELIARLPDEEEQQQYTQRVRYQLHAALDDALRLQRAHREQEQDGGGTMAGEDLSP